jgi:hypothetical protein
MMLRLAAGCRPIIDRACARKPEHTMTNKLIIAEGPSVANDIARDRIYERATAR